MIHDRLLSGQFMLDLKPQCSTFLQTTTNNDLHKLSTAPMALRAAQLDSSYSPIRSLDVYSVYAYQQQHHLQNEFKQAGGTIVPPQNHNHANTIADTEKVLDLSRTRTDHLEACTTSSPIQHTADSLSITTSQEYILEMNSMNNTSNNNKTSMHDISSFSKSPSIPTVYSNLCQSKTISTNSLKQTEDININREVLKNFTTTAMTDNGFYEPATASAVYSKNFHPLTANNTPFRMIDHKNTRPFKAYPRDPLIIAATFAAADVLMDNPRVERYAEYRKRVLDKIRCNNGGTRTICNPKMRRSNTRCTSISEVETSSITSEIDERLHTEESSDCDSNTEKNNNNYANHAIINEEEDNTNLKKVTSTIDSSIKLDKHKFNKERSSLHNSNEAHHPHSDNVNINNPLSCDVPKITNYSSNSSGSVHAIVKDAAYYERRRKNNAAAKKSRDRRRIKEDEIAIRAAYLERQNIELLCQIDSLKAQLAAYSNKIAI